MGQDKRCLKCKKTFTPSKFHPQQKYCKACSKEVKRMKIRQWWKEKGREYIRQYMKHYRNLTIILTLLCTGAEGAWFDDIHGQATAQGSFIKPPKYQLSLKVSDNSYLTLSRFQIRNTGWIQQATEEEEGEQRQAGNWSLEYGGQGLMTETSLLEQDSVWGWKLTLGQTAEFAWGKGSYGDRIALAGINTEKYSLMFVKSWGMPEEQGFSLDEPLTKTTAKPITRYQGGDIKIPYRWRQTSGDIEVAWKQRYDEQAAKSVSGIAVAMSANSPRIRISFRDITKNFESQVRTTDVQVRAIVYKEQDYEVYTGAGIIDFSGSADTRYSAIAGASVRKFGITFAPETQFFRQGNNAGVSYSGTLSGSVLNTQIALRRGENITGQTLSRSNNVSIGRKEGSISFNYSTSESSFAHAKNIDTNISLNLPYQIRVSAGGGISRQETPDKIMEYKRGSVMVAIKDTSFNATLSPQAESYTVSRRFTITTKQAVSLGISYQRFIGGDGVTGVVTYFW